MAGTIKRLAGPAYIASSAANIYVPGTNKYGVVRQIHVANVDTAARTFSLYIGATGGSAGGTQLLGTFALAPNSDMDRYFAPGIRLETTDFLTGVASSASTLVITVLGEEFAS